MIRNSNLKGRVQNLITSSGLPRLITRCIPQRVAILRYHSVQDDPTRYSNSIGDAIIHSASVFEAQMEFIARQCHPVTMDEVLDFARGEKTLPRRAVAVTFDDGYVDNLEIAIPILNRFGVRASFYITVGPVETARPPWFCRLRHAFGTTLKQTWHDSKEGCMRNITVASDRKSAFLVASERCARLAGDAQDQTLGTIEQELEVEPLSAKLMMTWDQVRAVHRSGHIVGSHTLTHPNMACMGLKDLHKECTQSKSKLESELGLPVHHFSYPSPILQPHWTQQTVDATEHATYKCAVTSTSGAVRQGSNPLCLKRMMVPSVADQFEWALENTLIGREIH